MEIIISSLKQINELILKQRTGSPGELSRKIHIGERQIYTYIRLMKYLGAPIVYNIKRKTYLYTEPGSFKVGFIDLEKAYYEHLDEKD
jgi:predicted DNA-binding transcriptional regulator YafY